MGGKSQNGTIEAYLSSLGKGISLDKDIIMEDLGGGQIRSV